MTDIVRTVHITHKYGLHVRASTRFVELARQFGCDVFISRPDGEEVDGKSVLAILTLGIEGGNDVVVRAQGDDAESALDALAALIADDFGGI